LHITHSISSRAPLWRRFTVSVGIFSLSLFVATTYAENSDKRNFDLPADAADKMLKLFSEQSDNGLIADSELIKGVQTKAVQGEFTPREALNQMLAGTGLTGEPDARSGGYTVRREGNDPSVAGTPNRRLPMAPATAPGTTKRLAPVESVVQLNPFEVNADSDNSYGALNSNSLTRFNAELDKMPISADIFDQTFMNDVGATNIEEMVMKYSAGAGIASIDETSGAASQPGDHVSHQFTQLRGFNTTSIQRDGLMALGLFYNPGGTMPGTTSNFNVERVEIVNGPQALLYTGGGAGGVISTVSKQARFNKTGAGSVLFRTDNYGSKIGELDYGFGTKRFAFRIALTSQSQQSRRVNIGTKLNGQYLQFAFRPVANTTVRIIGEQSTSNHVNPSSLSLSAGSSAADSRQSYSLKYLLAANLTGAAASGPNSQGAILGGLLNFGNADSLQGWGNSEKGVSSYGAITVETKWGRGLSSQFAAGYNKFSYDLISTQSSSLYTPGNPTNPTGTWAVGATPIDTWEPARNKAIRFSLLAENDLFNGLGKSQTIVGADYVRSDAFSIVYDYFLADTNFNAVVNPLVTTKNGRTQLSNLFVPVANGPQMYTYSFSPPTPRVTINGVNYVRGIAQIVDRSLISPSNPLGTTSAGTYEFLRRFDHGIYAVNYTQWLDGRVTTIAGVRFANVFGITMQPGNPDNHARSATTNTNFGVDAQVFGGIRAYANISNSYSPPLVLFADPTGRIPVSSRGIGGETGLKISNRAQSVSGSISYYYTQATNEEHQIPSALQTDINPTGLNGAYGGTTSTYVNVDRASLGLQATVTANPTRNWRLRFSASTPQGTILNDKSYPQLYNDQFHANGSRQVTYADGTPVYVKSVYDSKEPFATVATAGAVPLTLDMMNTSASPYYASPVNPSGAILASSIVATILKGGSGTLTDPQIASHGSILTGATGLPISALQIKPAFAIPGVIQIQRAGERTVGYPQLAANLTSVYTLDSGFAKGIHLGGTLSGQWRYTQFYYYPNGIATLQKTSFQAPTKFTADFIGGYTHRFKHVTWSGQLNVVNMFNNYRVLILPNQSTGWTVNSSLRATFFGAPRTTSLSSSLRF
jgi:outer membrane receptor protein involved in Fe transport